jgi:hypothetical protein
MNLKITQNTLKKLEQLFEEARYIIRFEKGTFSSGYCILEQRKVVVINKFLNLEGRINALVEIIPSLKINQEELSSEMLKFYKSIVGIEPQSENAVQTQMDF